MAPKTKKISAKFPKSKEINSYYSKLSEIVNNLGDKIGGVVQSKEDNFYEAFKVNMYQIMQEMKILRDQLSE